MRNSTHTNKNLKSKIPKRYRASLFIQVFVGFDFSLVMGSKGYSGNTSECASLDHFISLLHFP